MSADQLIFDLPTRPAFSREDFMVSPANAEAVAMVENWQNWPEQRLCVTGPNGAGKTHLAHVWATLAGARIVPASALASLGDTANVPLVVDDADTLAQTGGEKHLFHLYNRLGEARTPLMITARKAPAHWGLELPDLASRLATLPVLAMKAPDDTLLAALLVKQFQDRQLNVTASLITYLMKHADRSFAGVQHLVDRLDKASIREKRPVTVAFARRILREA